MTVPDGYSLDYKMTETGCGQCLNDTLPTGPRDITDIYHLFKHTGGPEKGVGGEFFKPLRAWVPLHVLFYGRTPHGLRRSPSSDPKAPTHPLAKTGYSPYQMTLITLKSSKPSVTFHSSGLGRQLFLCFRRRPFLSWRRSAAY